MLVAGPGIEQPPRRPPYGLHRVVVSACLASLRCRGRCARSALLLLLAALGPLASGGSAAAQEARKTILVLLPDQPGLPAATLGLAGLRSTFVAT
jgi:hypothetical protein